MTYVLEESMEDNRIGKTYAVIHHTHGESDLVSIDHDKRGALSEPLIHVEHNSNAAGGRYVEIDVWQLLGALGFEDTCALDDVDALKEGVYVKADVLQAIGRTLANC